MAEVTPELVRQLAQGINSRQALADRAPDIAAAYLQACEERDRLRARLASSLQQWEDTSGANVDGVRHPGAHPYRQGVQDLIDHLRGALGGSDV